MELPQWIYDEHEKIPAERLERRPKPLGESAKFIRDLTCDEIILIQVNEYISFKLSKIFTGAEKFSDTEGGLNEEIRNLERKKIEIEDLICESIQQNNPVYTRFIGVDENWRLCELTVIEVTVVCVETSPSFSPSPSLN